MRLTITLLPDDLLHGTDTCTSCPVVLASNRALAAAGFPVGRTEGAYWTTWEYRPDGVWTDSHGVQMTAGLSICRRYNYSRYDPICTIPVSAIPREVVWFAQLFDRWYSLMHYYDGDVIAWQRDNPDERVQLEPPRPITFTVELPLEKEQSQ